MPAARRALRLEVMSHFLFATSPADGHTLPALPIASALIRRGHTVAWYAGAAYAERIRSIGANFRPMSAHDFSVVDIDDHFPGRRELSGPASLKFDLEFTFSEPTRTHLRDLLALLADESADLVVGDTGLIAGPMLTELGGPPFAAFGISVVGFPSRDLAPFGLGLEPSRSALGRMRNAVLTVAVRKLLYGGMARTVNTIRGEFGLPPTSDIVFEYMRHAALYLQLGAAGFEYPRSDPPSNLRFVGPSRPWKDEDWRPPVWWQDLAADRPVVLVNQGTVATDPRDLLVPALAALAGDDVLVVAVTGGRDPAELGPVPANARVERFLPFAHLLPHVDALVTNGGFGAVQLALAEGVPIVAAGQSEDKVEVSARVGWSGVGINLRTQRPRRDFITAAVRQVLTEPRFRRRAAELQAEIRDLGREEAAADELEQLVRKADRSRGVRARG
jgi:MGT family glycosyltransferase